MRFWIALMCASAPAALAQPAGGFKHVVIIVQENRTPDNIFGSNPTFETGVDIATSGQNSKGQVVPLTAEQIDSCYDVKHQHLEFVQMYANGRMNGADQEELSGGHGNKCHAPQNPQFKFADNSTGTVQPYFDIAKQYGFANRMFQTNQGPSYPAHQFLFGATSAPTATSPLFVADNLLYKNIGAGCEVKSKQRVAVIDQYGSETSNPPVFTCFDRPTMADLLDGAGLSWTYYVNTTGAQGGQTSIWNAPASIQKICGANGQGHGADCKGAEYAAHVESRQAQVLKDIQHCKLPAVSWVIPNGTDSDHAGITGPTGPAWVASIVNAVGTQGSCSGETYWNDTAILITWDDWGGWYDHVPPFLVKGAGSGWGAGYTYGFRVPLLVVSAYTPAGFVDNANHDFGSLLQFVEANFNLGRIGAGGYADAYASNLLEFFTLGQARTFQPIGSKLNAAHFLTTVRSSLPVDDD